ncbi:MAG: chorismate synthase [Sulfuricurvum sp. PC08-66]|nr:MAG: chorismate synthase [Sulfuricurvum sp. PC08-66]
MNQFGKRFTFMTFGESHGKAIGCIVDGVPAGMAIDEAFIQAELDRRRPGQNKYTTQRKEEDRVEILSGVFEGVSTGTPIAMVIYNTNQKSGDYSAIKDIFRPGHADFGYFHKYGLRDYRGGGRSSARETAARVAAGAIAKMLCQEVGIKFMSGVVQVGGSRATQIDFAFAQKSEIFALDASLEEHQKSLIDEARKNHDSIGGAALVRIQNAPIGLGEPLYYRLDAALADAMMGINAVKGVEIGEGTRASTLHGSQNNDAIAPEGFATNHAGGILGGISNGEAIDIYVYFKPTPSIFIEQQTINTDHEATTCKLEGRHDPFVAARGSVVAESMAALVIADMLLLNMGRTLKGVKNYYGN